MSVTDDRRFTKAQIYAILENVKGKTLGEVDKSHQFDRTIKSEKITGIAGDVIEQSVLGYERDSNQECDIEIDGVLTELKTTGVRIPKSDLKNVRGKTGEAYNVYLGAKEGISITNVTFEPTIETDFNTSHFWEKSEHLLIVLYEYKSYEVVPASCYAQFPIVDYCYNSFSDEEKAKLQNDWEIVREHFNKSRANNEIVLKESFSSFTQLDARCHALSERFRGKTLAELKKMLGVDASVKDIAAKCVIRMFGTDCKRLNQISDFTKAGIIAKTITITPTGGRTEDMKLKHIDFEEWADRDVDFEDSDVYDYFCEHSFLCPIFCEHDSEDLNKTTFEGFKRFAFDEEFIENEVRRTWKDSRNLIYRNELKWEYVYDKQGHKRKNSSGSYMGAPNFPKSSEYKVFFRGGADVSTEKTRTECVNGIRMLPQFFWLKGSYITNKLQEIPYI